MHNLGLFGSHSSVAQIQFVDYHTVEWPQVKRTHYFFYQRFHYQYPGPIHNLRQRLMVIPTERYGAQQVRDHLLRVNPEPSATRTVIDTFGNRVFEFELVRADQDVYFEVLMIVESETHHNHALRISPEEAARFLRPTPLTTPDAQLMTIAQELAAQAHNPHDLVQRISDWVHHAMHYGSGATTVETTAAQALAIGRGLCQDYAHLMITLCRALNLPARYVSGHLLGEGGSHAWVEVLLPPDTDSPDSADLTAYAFDPTNRRRPNLSYITVAVGRDYSDVSPVSGSFTAPYSGHLTCRKRAGLTFVEYLDGRTLGSETLQWHESSNHNDSAAR